MESAKNGADRWGGFPSESLLISSRAPVHWDSMMHSNLYYSSWSQSTYSIFFFNKQKRLSLLFTYNISKQLIKMFSLILLQREPITTPTAYVNIYGSSTLTQLVSWVTNHKVVDEFSCFCMRVGLVKTIHFVTIDDTSGVPRSINSSNYSTLARH